MENKQLTEEYKNTTHRTTHQNAISIRTPHPSETSERHQLQNSGTYSATVPYSGKRNKSDLRFDLENFPPQLKQILYTFLKLHMKKMESDAIPEATRVQAQ